MLEEFKNVNPEKFAEWDNFDPYGRGVIDINVSAQGSRIQMLDSKGFPTGRTTVEGINASLGNPNHKDDYVRVRLYIVKVDDVVRIQSMTGSLVHGLGHVDGGKRRDEPYAVQYEIDNYQKKKK